MVVVLSASPGLPTTQTMTANANASRKLKRGPAIATMILSIAEMGGSTSFFSSPLPSIKSIGAICGNDT